MNNAIKVLFYFAFTYVGAINTLIAHGSDALKDKYLPRLISGEWTGTMCLTEPQCGSDLGIYINLSFEIKIYN
jgi:alkylation response protein AidB-like acyl-CoA dehydrogenase